MVRAGMGAAVMPMLAVDANDPTTRCCARTSWSRIRPHEVCVMWQARTHAVTTHRHVIESR